MHNTREEVDRAVDILSNVVKELRELSPFMSKNVAG
jgi:cysteine sulfinate desulfinase/cysteine desulfurase-like protein